MKLLLCAVLGMALWTALRPVPSRYIALDDAPTGFGAATYFENSCARCHGEEGGNYSVESLKKRPDASLRGEIHDMADGPGQAPLDEKQLNAVTAWHRALIEGEPWVGVTKIERDNALILHGEATTKTQISVSSGDKTVAATSDGLQWTATLPLDSDVNSLQVLATRGDTKTTLKLSESAFSQAK